jgi:hypothetical protein
MQNGKTREFGTRSLITSALVGFALVACISYWVFPRYVSAIAWHCFHGNYAVVGGSKIKLPIVWWVGDAALLYPGLRIHDTVVLERACNPNIVPVARIQVRAALLGEVKKSDQEEFESTKASIARTNSNAGSGTSEIFVTIKSQSSRMYCVREDTSQFGIDLATQLTCHVANLPYSFHYSGNPTYEKEAESILSGLE